MPVTYYTQQEYLDLMQDKLLAEKRLAAAEALRPQWAMGYSDDSIAAQLSTSALTQIYGLLGVTNQTHCMEKLRAILRNQI